jgi:hypothetical protein
MHSLLLTTGSDESMWIDIDNLDELRYRNDLVKHNQTKGETKGTMIYNANLNTQK